MSMPAETNITKGVLARALKILMKEKEFSKISVTDICEKSKMNRKSFYYHFKDKFDLMNWIFYTEFIDVVTSSEVENGWELLEAVLTMFYNDREFYGVALKTEGQNSFSEYFRDSMLPIVKGVFGDNFGEKVEVETMINIFADATLSGASQWIALGCKIEPAEFVDSVKKLILRIAGSIK